MAGQTVPGQRLVRSSGRSPRAARSHTALRSRPEPSLVRTASAGAGRGRCDQPASADRAAPAPVPAGSRATTRFGMPSPPGGGPPGGPVAPGTGKHKLAIRAVTEHTDNTRRELGVDLARRRDARGGSRLRDEPLYSRQGNHHEIAPLHLAVQSPSPRRGNTIGEDAVRNAPITGNRSRISAYPALTASTWQCEYHSCHVGHRLREATGVAPVPCQDCSDQAATTSTSLSAPVKSPGLRVYKRAECAWAVAAISRSMVRARGCRPAWTTAAAIWP